MPFESVSALIKKTLTDAHVEIADMTGTNDHLDILIVSDAFIGKMLFQQHKMIMSLLTERLKTDIHAVQLKTLTFNQAREQGMKL